MLDREELRSCAEALEQFAEFSKERVEIGVSISHDDYYFDLGAFGEQSTYVEVEDEYYPIDVSHILEKGPLDGDDAREIAESLRKIADAPEEDEFTLDDVLARMVSAGTADEQWLARVLMGVADVLRGFHAPAAPAVISATVPEVPAPWPGALRDDIDYTAEDFPLRYQPPPGFRWGTGERAVTVDDPHEAKSSAASTISGNKMLIDEKGRVSWGQRGDADFSEGIRWHVWHAARDGIAGAKQFFAETPPRAIDSLGLILPEPSTETTKYGAWDYNWDSGRTAEDMEKLLSERLTVAAAVPAAVETVAPADAEEDREEFAPPAPVAPF